MLLPSFENAFWRSRSRARFREQAGFSKAKGHFEPEDLSSHAQRWAEELTRADSAEEIRRIYENAVTILKNRRSRMERTERTLDAPQFRYHTIAEQDPSSPAHILCTKNLVVHTALDKLPEYFDDLFPYKPTELVVPVMAEGNRKEILVKLEDWEELLQGKLSESADQNVYTLELRNGFSLTVDLLARETSFAKKQTEGVLALASELQRDLKALKIPKRLF